MKLLQLLDSIKYESNVSPEIEVTDITCDSRKVKEGTVFVCINGTAADGHSFAQRAAGQGACAIVCERELGLKNQVTVENSRSAYADMCANFFGNPSKKLALIGLTGTNGKTTVAFLLKHILEACGHKAGLIGTIQNMVGDRVLQTNLTTPDAYCLQSLFAQMVGEGCDCCVMEVSSHALEQDRVRNLHFKTAVFTNLTQDHLDLHGTMENYYHAKRRLFDMCDNAVINADDFYGAEIAKSVTCKKLQYSIEGAGDLTAQDVHFFSDRAAFTLRTPSGEFQAAIPVPGKFSVYNALAAAGAAFTMGLSEQEIIAALQTAQGVKGRAEVFLTGRDFTVIIDYAHTPDGIVNVVTAMREVAKGRIVTLFGCGGDRDPKKRPLMGAAAAELSDFVIVTSDNPRTENSAAIIADIMPGVKKYKTPYVVIENRREAICFAIDHAQKDDIIILAGKGHETYQVLGTEKVHFDEREILAECLK